MKYSRIETKLKPLKSVDATFLWGNDGWCYIPELKMRQKFTQTEYEYEKWEGVIAMPLNVEKLSWKLYSKSPRIWSEGADVFSLGYP